jgi:hypothetical protein
MDFRASVQTLVGAIAAAQFPIYGIVDHPLDLISDSRIVSTESLPFPTVTSIVLNFTSPRYPSCLSKRFPLRNFRVRSQVAQEVRLGEWDEVLDLLVQEQEQLVRNPFLWEGSLSLAGTIFHGKMRYYATPLKLSEYHLMSEKSYVSGYACGPSCDELIELLEGLEVLNGRDEVIREQYTSH